MAKFLINKDSIYCCVFCMLLSIAGVSFAETSNKWLIEVDGGADSDGEIVFNVTPEQGEAIPVRVTLKNGTGENNVAKTIRDAFELQLPREQYKIKIDDGEKVKIKADGDAKDFNLTLVSNSVKNTKIEIKEK